jgi:hypothetical protein
MGTAVGGWRQVAYLRPRGRRRAGPLTGVKGCPAKLVGGARSLSTATGASRVSTVVSNLWVARDHVRSAHAPGRHCEGDHPSWTFTVPAEACGIASDSEHGRSRRPLRGASHVDPSVGGLNLLGCKDLYSITLSAIASSVGGTSMPSALAVPKLIANMNLVACATGRSAGLAPLRIHVSEPARQIVA